jgi:anti-sigma factor RsiW
MHHLIQACLDGAATREQGEAVKAHVARCSRCARVMEQSRRLADLLASMPERRVSSAFEAGLRSGVNNAVAVPPTAAWLERFRLRFEWRLRLPALVGVGAVAAALLAASVTPRYVRWQELQRERGDYVSAAVRRHRELGRQETRPDWDAVDSSVELSTGGIVTE